MRRDGEPKGDGSSLIGLSQRLPPCNLEAEAALLGAVLADNRVLHRVLGFLKPDAFYDPINGRIYKECARLVLRGQLADAVTLRTVFEQSGTLDEVGGTAYLARLLASMVAPNTGSAYGRAIHDAWIRRKLINVGETIVHNAFGAEIEMDGEAQVTAASDALLDLSSGASKEAPEISAGDAARMALHDAEEISRTSSRPGLSWGLAPIDEVAGRLMDEWFYIVGARSGMGKSALLVQTAVGVGRQLRDEEANAAAFSGAGGDAVIFSAEMPAKQFSGWMLCHMAQVSNDVLTERPMTASEAVKLMNAQRELDTLPIKVVDAVGLSGPAIAIRSRAMHSRRRVRFVGVDHIQKVVSSTDGYKAGETTIATARTTSAMKDLCRQLHCPVVALSQIGREVDKRDDPRPRLSDLQYAGETDGDVVLMLFRAERYLPKRPPEKFPKETDEQHAKRVDAWHRRWDEARDRAEAIVPKRRSGKEGYKVLRFDGPTTTFSEIGAPADPDQANWVEDYGS